MKRLSSILLCAAVLAFASASSAEDPAGEPESETLAVVAEGFDVRIPVPDGWFRIDDLEAETPVPQGYRRLAVLAPRDVTQRATIGIPSTVVEVLLYLETAMTPVSAQTFATARKLLMDKFVGREEFDRLTLPPDDPYRPGIPWRECGDRWCCAGCLLPPGSVVYGNPMNVFLSKATGAVLVRGAVVQIDFTKHLSNEEEDAKLRDEAVRYLLEFVALNPVAEDENAVRTSSELVQCSDRDLKGEPLPSCNEDASESHGTTDAMIRAFLAFVYFVMVLLVFLKFRKMILWKYARFDDFKWDGRSDFPKTNLKPGRGSK